ncbi:hypothetical protein F442_16380, partial [Phytophthora nicotianae P10297]
MEKITSCLILFLMLLGMNHLQRVTFTSTFGTITIL